MSATFKITTTVSLETTECCSCGITFALPADFLARKREMGAKFYCPNGHPLFFGDNELTRTQKELAQEQTKRAQVEARVQEQHEYNTRLNGRNQALSRSLSAQKGVTTRIKNRVSNGVCPCCNRHFVNLERHMKGRHPDFTKEDEAA